MKYESGQNISVGLCEIHFHITHRYLKITSYLCCHIRCLNDVIEKAGRQSVVLMGADRPQSVQLNCNCLFS